MIRLPDPIQNAVSAFSRLPGVGPKTALRYVFYLLKQPKHELETMARTINALSERVNVCGECFTYCERELCDICSDARRDASALCVVEEARDIAIVESTGVFGGHYHVLGGMLNPIEGMTPEVLRVRELLARAKDPRVQEIILAFSPDTHGETTMLYLVRQLSPLQKKITRLARGLPTGASLEFADEVTLADALTGRRQA